MDKLILVCRNCPTIQIIKKEKVDRKDAKLILFDTCASCNNESLDEPIYFNSFLDIILASEELQKTI